MLLSSFPLTLVVEADGTDSGAASTGKKFKSLFTMNTVQNIYKVTIQGQGSRDGLVGKVLCIYIYIYTHRCRERGKERIPRALLFCHSRSHCSTLHATPANKHSKWGQVQEIYTQRENRSKQTQIAQRSSHEMLRVTTLSSGWKTDQ